MNNRSMKERPWASGFLMLLLLSGYLLLISCGAASQSASSSNDTTTYVGNASLSGTIVVSESELAKIGATNSQPSSSLSSKLASVQSNLIRVMSEAAVLNSGTAVLYEIKDDGSIVSTGVTTPVVDGSYNFENIANGKKYIVRIIEVGENTYGQKQMLKMDSFADIPDGITAATADVTEKTGLISNYIVTKVVQPSGSKFNKETSEKLYNKALETINSKLITGEIVRISPVENVSSEDTTLDFGEPTPLQKFNIEVIDNSDDLRTLVKIASFESRSNQVTTVEDAKRLISSIFGQESQNKNHTDKSGSSDNGPPDFFITQFAQALLNNVESSIADMAPAYHNAIMNESIKAALTPEILTNLMLAQANTADGKLAKLYAIYDGAEDDPNIPYYAKVIFPKNNRWTLPITATQKLTVPQAIFFFVMSGLIDGSAVPEDLQNQLEGIPFEPFSFLTEIQFISIVDGNFYIVDKQIRSIKTYKKDSEDHFVEIDALESSVQIYADNETLTELDHVTLRYPRASGGFGEVSYALYNRNQGNSVSSTAQKATLTADGISKITSESSNANPLDAEWLISPYDRGPSFTPTFITDYTSGEATVTAYNANNQVLVSSTMTIIKPNIGAATWVYPPGQDMAKVQSQGWDPTFVPSELDVADDNKAHPTLQWSAPSGTIPSGHYLAYAINLGLWLTKINYGESINPSTEGWNYINDVNGYRWKQIWSSWDNNRLITSTSFSLPEGLPVTTIDQANNYQTSYEINITPVLVESNTGRVVWQGSEARTNFQVGVTDPWAVTITGRVTFSNKIDAALPKDGSGNTIPGTWKVGIFKTGGSDAQGQWTESFHITGSKEPISTGNKTIIATLGSTDSIAGNGYTADYTFDQISKNDVLFERNSNYNIIVWYDVTNTPSTNGWASFGPAQIDKIDLSTKHYLEFSEQSVSKFWADREGIKVFQNNQSTSIVAPDTTLNIPISVGQYW